jgi:hypothetical protein
LRDHQPDGAVLVTTPQAVALADVRKELNFCRKVGLPILGVVENMSGFVCPHCAVYLPLQNFINHRNVQISFQPEEVKPWRMSLVSHSSVHQYLMNLIVGRAPIDPNFVLAIERNQQHQTERNSQEGRQDGEANGTVITTIVDEYKQLALYDIFKSIVSQLIPEDSAVQV